VLGLPQYSFVGPEQMKNLWASLRTVFLANTGEEYRLK
jgi:hypothetical protein